MPAGLSFELASPQGEQQFKDYFYFRWLYLRKPLQLPLGSEQDDIEDSAYHCMALNNDGDIIGVGRIHLDSINTAQIRFMAVAPANQRCGVGKQILDNLCSYAAANQVAKIWLKARDEASSFYLSQGYEIKSSVETDLAIPHVLMEKYL